MIPPLEHDSNSWVVTRKATGEVIGEFFDRRNVEKFNPATCQIETSGQYLSRLHLEHCPECKARITRNERRAS